MTMESSSQTTLNSGYKPRFAVESVDQISDGSTLQVYVPKKRVFISAQNVKNKAACHLPSFHGLLDGLLGCCH